MSHTHDVLCSARHFVGVLMRFYCYLLLFIASFAQADQDADFLAARDAFRAGDTVKLAQFAQRLKKSPLEVYVSYYQLRLALERAPPEVIQAFLERPEDSPMIDRLRGEWLKQLGKQQQWTLFDAEYPRLINQDIELNCYALQSRLHAPPQQLSADIHSLWLSGKTQPDSCNTLFETALSSGIISEQEVWQRLRLALEENNIPLTKQLVEQLAHTNTISLTALDTAISNAERFLATLKQGTINQGEQAIALFAIQRLAKQSLDLAITHWDKISADFPAEQRSYFYGWLGYEAARQQDSRALQWYGLADTGQLNEQQLAWRARAALRELDWPEILLSIGLMPEAQQQEGVWRYWQARALQAEAQTEQAIAIFTPLSKEFNFYGQLASDELGDTVSHDTGLRNHQPGKQDIAIITTLPGVQRSVALYRMGLPGDALNEWSWTIRNFNDQELLAAAEIARRNKMYDRAIGTADKTTNLHDFNLRYLAPYRHAAMQHIRANKLDEAWVYGLMRQESRFVTQAKSTAGAAGLMQIMPATARLMAKKLGLKNYRGTQIQKLDTNLKLGTYYMKTILSQFDDSPVLASAAYNAGPRRAERWRADYPLEGAIYIETIPFNETRNYVKKVMSNTMYYARQFGISTDTLKSRLGTIAGKLFATHPALDTSDQVAASAIADQPEPLTSLDDTQPAVALEPHQLQPDTESATP